MVRSVSVGSRQTRKKRRARRRRAELRESASAVLRESVRTGRNVLRESASTLLSTLITVACSSAKGVGQLAGIVLREPSRAGQNLLVALMHASTRSAARDSLLFVALLGSSAAVVTLIFAGKVASSFLFCLLSLILCATLWVRGRREPSKERRRLSSTGRTGPDVGDRVDR